MTPELLTAVGERIKIGRSQTEIVSELVAAGYAPEVAHAAYQAAFSAPSSLTSDVANYAPAYVSGDAVESQEYESSAPYATAASSSLIGLGRLFSGSTHLLFNQGSVFFYTIGLLIAGFVVTLIVPIIIFTNINPFILLVALPIGLLAFCVLALLVSAATVRALLLRRSPESYFKHVGYVFKNILPVLWVTFLVAVIVGVGLILLIIPGVIAQFLLLFALPLLVIGQARGFGALRLSAELVWGHFFGVVGRLLVCYLAVFIALGILFFVVSVVFGISAIMSQSASFIPGLLFAGSIALVSVWLIAVSVLLLESLFSLPRTKNIFSQ